MTERFHRDPLVPTKMTHHRQRRRDRPLLGITMGDPAGIGPELVVRFFTESRRPAGADYVVIGQHRYLARESEGLGLPVVCVPYEPGTAAKGERGTIPLLEVGPSSRRAVRRREVSAAAGRCAASYITEAVSLARAGQIDAVVTCPIHKVSLHKAGFDFPGHTEMIAHLCGVDGVALMLVHDRLRIVHLTTHMSLREACRKVDRERILQVLELVHAAGRQLGMKTPRIAVAALNPHGGEEGLFGDEEIRHIIPAVRTAKKRGMDVHGPFPADSVFPMCAGGTFDFALAMYHDQGHIPLKLLGFRWERSGRGWGRVRGVNVTLGLPIVRTSVDHGVAFDIVGQGKASLASLYDAVRLAIRLAAGRQLEGGAPRRRPRRRRSNTSRIV